MEGIIAATEAPSDDPRIVLAYAGNVEDAAEILEAAAELGRRLGRGWTFLHVELPGGGGKPGAAAESLSHAAQLGATVASVAAATPADAIVAYTAHAPASHIVLPAQRRRLPFQKTTADRLLERLPGVAVVLKSAAPAGGPVGWSDAAMARPRDYGIAALAVVLTVPFVILLRAYIGAETLALLFLLPVLGVAARLGWRPSLLSIALAVLAYNFFVLAPVYHFQPRAPQNWLMLAVLLGLSGYVSLLTSRLRQRLALSDRSAEENAGLVTFGLELAKAGDWQSTAEVVCRAMAEILKVRAALFREIEGDIVLEGAFPATPALSPVDRAALDLAWAQGEETGAGTERLSAADWQYQPLKTSLGLMAVVGLASEDGRDPVRPDRRVLCAMLITQAALAHERLRLEDLHAARRPACPAE